MQNQLPINPPSTPSSSVNSPSLPSSSLDIISRNPGYSLIGLSVTALLVGSGLYLFRNSKIKTGNTEIKPSGKQTMGNVTGPTAKPRQIGMEGVVQQMGETESTQGEASPEQIQYPTGFIPGQPRQ